VSAAVKTVGTPDTGFGTPQSNSPLKSYVIYLSAISSILAIAIAIRKYSKNNA
jgi:hypothetical protein